MDINVIMKNPAKMKDRFARWALLFFGGYALYRIAKLQYKVDYIEKFLKDEDSETEKEA